LGYKFQLFRICNIFLATAANKKFNSSSLNFFNAVLGSKTTPEIGIAGGFKAHYYLVTIGSIFAIVQLG